MELLQLQAPEAQDAKIRLSKTQNKTLLSNDELFEGYTS